MRVSRIVQLVPDSPYLLGETSFGEPRLRWSSVDISVVLPCLNEAESVGFVVKEAIQGIRRTGLSGEVIVVDNGSTDDSARVARNAGARVITESERGYGSACRRGLGEARGSLIFLGDSDGSYPFYEIPRFVALIEDGADVVIGNRLNETMERGAMPWLHRHVGNPGLTRLLNLLFRARVGDAHCGLRAIRSDASTGLNLKATGMEFASEYVIEAITAKLTIAQVPITYRRRLAGEPKLRTWRDGSRHVRLILRSRARLRALGHATAQVEPNVPSSRRS
jgi:glycosyltransferase involved in cell wall biosynthesis